MDCSLPDSSVHGILQARILEWVAIPFSKGSSWPRNQNWVSCMACKFFTISATSKYIWHLYIRGLLLSTTPHISQYCCLVIHLKASAKSASFCNLSQLEMNHERMHFHPQMHQRSRRPLLWVKGKVTGQSKEGEGILLVTMPRMDQTAGEGTKILLQPG